MRLALDMFTHFVEFGADFFLDRVAPQIDTGLGGGRRLQAGEPLAHHHGQRIGQRRIGLIGDLVVIAAVIFVIEHGAYIARNALHAARADGLDAGLFHRIKHLFCLVALRGQFAMQGLIVTSQTQRHGIAITAHDRRIMGRQATGRLGQAGALIHQRGAIGGIGDFEIRTPRQSTHRHGHRPLERFGGCFFRLCGLAIA